jgi:exonuclease VII large subunit
LGRRGNFQFQVRFQRAFLFFVERPECLNLGGDVRLCQQGPEIQARGRIESYLFWEGRCIRPKRQYKIIVERIEPKGIGSQQLAFEQLKKSLLRKGCLTRFIRNRCRNAFSVGIVTSGSGAAILISANPAKRSAFRGRGYPFG